MRISSFAPGEYYHLYSRGVEKRVIFFDENDHDRFIKLLFFCNSSKSVNIRELPKGLTFAECVDKKGEKLVALGAYCLMPNHFHLLVRETSGKGISLFMQKLLTAYTMYFNAKNQRKGRLFESPFMSTHADYDEYLKYIFAYIHLNPLKLIDPEWKEKGFYNQDQAKRTLQGYRYSSFMDYAGSRRDENYLLNSGEFPEYFPEPSDFISYLDDWMNYGPAKV